MLRRLLLAVLTIASLLGGEPPGAGAEVVRHSVPCGTFARERAFCVYDVRPGQAAGLSCHDRGWRVTGYDASILAHDGEDYVDVLDHAPAGRHGAVTIARYPNGAAVARVTRGTWDVAVWCRRP